MTEAELARIVREVLAATRTLCASGRQLDYHEAFTDAARDAMIRYELTPGQVLRLISAAEKSLRKRVA